MITAEEAKKISIECAIELASNSILSAARSGHTSTTLIIDRSVVNSVILRLSEFGYKTKQDVDTVNVWWH